VTRVLIVYTGGTIGMRPDAVNGGLVPALSGEELVGLDPTLGDIAELDVLAWGAKPSTALSFEDVLDIARTVRRGAERPDIDGIVVVQGTDLLEETAYALDLLLRLGKPLALVGAMRAAEEPGSDAQVNLRDAVRVAATPAPSSCRPGRSIRPLTSSRPTRRRSTPSRARTRVRSVAYRRRASHSGGALRGRRSRCPRRRRPSR
jgi:L-asparaginase/Glu-tRNA(Gln) amidotransferase subunit D